MKIVAHKSLKEIQEEFHIMFPGLKIEFYQKPHSQDNGSPKEEQIDSVFTIGEIATLEIDREIVITPNMKVSAVEQLFADHYGLYPQIFRRSANLWLQTSKTDDWTLEVQNRKGLHSAEFA
jgi:hypothetical protein